MYLSPYSHHFSSSFLTLTCSLNIQPFTNINANVTETFADQLHRWFQLYLRKPSYVITVHLVALIFKNPYTIKLQTCCNRLSRPPVITLTMRFLVSSCLYNAYSFQFLIIISYRWRWNSQLRHCYGWSWLRD